MYPANQDLINWKDSKAICPTSSASGGNTGQDAGDFWIDDPTNNPNKNKYEDANGNWVQVTFGLRRLHQPGLPERGKRIADAAARGWRVRHSYSQVERQHHQSHGPQLFPIHGRAPVRFAE